MAILLASVFLFNVMINNYILLNRNPSVTVYRKRKLVVRLLIGFGVLGVAHSKVEEDEQYLKGPEFKKISDSTSPEKRKVQLCKFG